MRILAWLLPFCLMACNDSGAPPAADPDLASLPDLASPPDEAPIPDDFSLPALDFTYVGTDLTVLYDIAASGDFAGQVFPAPHPPAPQGVNLGGRMLTSPRLVSVTFAGDKLAASLDAFLAALPDSAWWPATMAEYGVRKGSTAPPIHLAEDAARRLDDKDVGAWLADKLDGNHPEFPTPPDPHALYLIYYPIGTTITLNGGASCASFGGYHQSTQLKNGTLVAYAVIPRCRLGTNAAAVDALTGVAAHEVVEAATDADPSLKRAWGDVDAANKGYGLAAGGAELADLCQMLPLAFYKDAFNFELARSWSNAAARDGHDPCVPAPAGQTYFNSAPVLTDKIRYFGADVPGMLIPAGKSATIELDLFSDGPTQPWTVSASADRSALGGSNQSLQFTFDKDTGSNGSKLHLTVKAVALGPNGHATFSILSTLGPTTNMWFVAVSDH